MVINDFTQDNFEEKEYNISHQSIKRLLSRLKFNILHFGDLLCGKPHQQQKCVLVLK